jgi:hypothetical protein
MHPARRQLLVSMSAFACAAFCRQVALGKSLLAAPFPANRERYGKALIAKMKRFNEPASTRQSGDQLVVTTKPKTDYWRKTFYDYLTDNGHFFFLPVTGDFSLESRVVGKYDYDQTGLMARIDSSNWLKCGLELVDGIGHASVVVTRDYSDWSTVRGIKQRNHCGGASSAKGLRSKFFILWTARTLPPRASAIFHSKRPWMRASCAALPKVRASTLPSRNSL